MGIRRKVNGALVLLFLIIVVGGALACFDGGRRAGETPPIGQACSRIAASVAAGRRNPAMEIDAPPGRLQRLARSGQ
jgi:hypothetical protein